MPEFLDTQVISYAAKGQYTDVLTGKLISSVVANEFLLVQSDVPTKANYYVPLLGNHVIEEFEYADGTKRDHPFRKRVTDQIVMYFGHDYPSIVEYGSLAIAQMLNERHYRSFQSAIAFLDKETQKTIKRRYRFLLESGVICVPLDGSAAQLSMRLLSEFTQTHNLKSNFRNSLNDLLILATAMDAGGTLITKDTELSRFAATQYAKRYRQSDSFVALDFDLEDCMQRVRSLESKGYINRSWQVTFKNYQGVPGRKA